MTKKLTEVEKVLEPEILKMAQVLYGIENAMRVEVVYDYQFLVTIPGHIKLGNTYQEAYDWLKSQLKENSKSQRPPAKAGSMNNAQVDPTQPGL